MACRDAYEMKTKMMKEAAEAIQPAQSEAENASSTGRLLFGVDSRVPSNDVLQNNLTAFEWAVRNKLYPNFWGRNITGENCLTKEEITFLRDKGCKIAVIDASAEAKETEEQGNLQAKKAAVAALELGIPGHTAVFLEIGKEEAVTTDYLRGYAQGMLSEGYTPGFMADTDAIFGFDREYSRGLQTDRELFAGCLIWAVSPSLKEYERITTSHMIHPDNWAPYAPSGITRNEIALWQYGKECHPIQDDAGNETSFNIDLVRDAQMIIDRMF